MRVVAATVFAMGLISGAAFAEGGNLTPPTNLGKTGASVPTGGNQPMSGRSTIVEPVPAPGAVIAPATGPAADDVQQSGAAPGGAKPGVGGMGSPK